MNRKSRIEARLQAALDPLHLEAIDESRAHAVPPDAESHFKIVAISAQFAGLPLLRRHRWLNALLEDELRAGLHALTLQTWTPDEWRARGERTPASPPCRGGSLAGTGDKGGGNIPQDHLSSR